MLHIRLLQDYFLTLIFLPAPLALIIFLYALTLPSGTLTTALLFIPLNALLPTFLAVSLLVFITIFFKFLQFLNAFLPMLVIFLPIVIFVSFLLPLNAFFAMAVTLYFLLLIWTDAGITISLMFFLALTQVTVLVPLTDATL